MDLGDGTYAAWLGGKYYRVDADLPTKGPNSRELSKADFSGDGTLWAPILEKAMCLWMSEANTYRSMAYDFFTNALKGLGSTDTGYKFFSEYADGTAILDDMATKLSAGLVVGMGFQSFPAGTPLIGNHVNSVIRVNYDGAGKAASLTLRNPWGTDGAGDDGKDDGYVTLKAAQLYATKGSAAWGSLVG